MQINLDRLPGESDTAYHKRLVYGKLVDKTLADVDYSELSRLVYGQTYSSDVARRMMYGSCRIMQMVDNEMENAVCTGDEYIAALEAEKIELQKERQRFYDQRREYNKMITKSGRIEHLEDRLVEAAYALENTIGRMEYRERTVSEYNDSEAVLVLSDWHYGMKTENVWNEYNTDICKKRVTDTVESTVQKLKIHNCHKLHIVLLGDLIHGAIHTSARVMSEELVCDQIIEVAEILAQSVEYISNHISEVDVHMTYGNHARTVQKKDESIHRDNMERIIPWWLSQRLKNCENIHFPKSICENNEFLYLEVLGYGVCASHGDLDTVKTSPRLLSSLFHKKYGKDIDYILLADKHHRESFEELGVCAMICGSLCGTDEYANNKRLYSSPEQTLLIFNKKVGLDAEYHIKV